MILARRLFGLAAWAVLFATAGALLRYVTKFQIESRFLIPMAMLAAVALEALVCPLFGMRRDLVRLATNCAAATCGIVAMKWMLEGFPSWLV